MTSYVKPHRTRASDLNPAWHVIDAQGKTLGRLSSEIAVLLQGKHKPNYVPYLNTGDFVVVINAEKFHVTGKKLDQKIYYRHSGYHGGLKEQTLSVLLQKAPTRAIKKAVKGMLPKNTLGRHMLSRLKLYAGDAHPHAAQVNARPKAAKAEDAQKTRSKATNAKAEEKTGAIDAEAEAIKAPAATVGSPKAANTPATEEKVKSKKVRSPRGSRTASKTGNTEADETPAELPETEEA
jgi:large subunit ribosomal protein L13